ncbi:carbohydrate kinase family protein [Janibacter melonis]|uniref:carbohydrate kinase family protein n=1 Tax=Janibacter melonis TaxID=262209 RepID=UPI00174BE45D|nr:PfkB family carbohydrate kinase [Janibacter melonis]
MTAPPFDPLSHLREPADAPAVEPEADVLLYGTVFLDLVLTGIDGGVTPGTEVWASGMGSSPGGIANLAVATSRLGLRTTLAAAFGDDAYGDFCWRTLEEQEGVALTRSRRYPDWHTPVTVSLAVDGDRSMISHGHPSPEPASALIGDPPCTRIALLDLHADDLTWTTKARQQGALLFADAGWDATGEWSTELLDRLDGIHAFTPNAVEAMAYTRSRTPHEAMYALADRVPLVVVTNGAEGALAIDSSTGEEEHVPALHVEAVDATGAGDVFHAAIALGTLAGWPLRDRLAFATLCSGLAVQHVGGSLAAPGWGDIVDWWRRVKADPSGTARCASVRRRFAFLDEIVPDVPQHAVRRAQATIARQSDV